jgi:hypothetical protein
MKDVAINRLWESIRENTELSSKDNVGYWNSNIKHKVVLVLN